MIAKPITHIHVGLYAAEAGVRQFFSPSLDGGRISEIRMSKSLFESLTHVKDFYCAIDPVTLTEDFQNGHVGVMYGANISLLDDPKVKCLLPWPDNAFVVFYTK